MAQMSLRRKRIAALIVLAGSGLIVERLVAFEADGDAAQDLATPVAPGRADAPRPAASTAATDLRFDKLETRREALSSALRVAPTFEPRSWQPPPPPRPPPPPPPVPVAPPFPYAYLGGMSDGGTRTGFFTRGDRVLQLRAGDTIDAAYRVETLTEAQMQLTYLPLNQTQTVALGGGR
ncbi:hypothetical protein [Methylibium sp.]|uniref:hypothetical protein n=1 Tax=Methylibium sp. TaxID=2067992 RepID=UPI003D0AF5EF